MFSCRYHGKQFCPCISGFGARVQILQIPVLQLCLSLLSRMWENYFPVTVSSTPIYPGLIPTAAVAKCHKDRGLKQHQFVSHNCECQESDNNAPHRAGIKLTEDPASFLPGALRKIWFLPFSASKVSPHSLARSPSLSLSSKPAITSHPHIRWVCHHKASSSPKCPLSLLKECLDLCHSPLPMQSRIGHTSVLFSMFCFYIHMCMVCLHVCLCSYVWVQVHWYKPELDSRCLPQSRSTLVRLAKMFGGIQSLPPKCWPPWGYTRLQSLQEQDKVLGIQMGN